MSEKIVITDEKVVVNGKTYLPETQVQSNPNYLGETKIVVLQRGWVFIGRFKKEGQNCTLANAFNIRSWGTKKGLPELVNGPTATTILDKCEGIVEFNELTIVCMISVKEESWKEI